MTQKQKPRRPLLGAHMSIAGGVGNALLLGAKVQCEAIQIFTKSSRQWACKPYTEEEIAQYRENQKTTGIKKVIAHDSYLLNLGSPDVVLRQRSILAFIDEMERCETLGISNLIAHPGSHVGSGEDQGLKTIASSLNEVHQACPGYNVNVTLEITAGQGSNLGYRFEHIVRMFDATRENERLRVCPAFLESDREEAEGRGGEPGGDSTGDGVVGGVSCEGAVVCVGLLVLATCNFVALKQSMRTLPKNKQGKAK